jgi:8-oxoguanine deaminase
MKATAALAERHNVRLHTHLAETADEEAFCLSRFGIRPLDYLDECGWLNDRTWLAHGIHFSTAEIDRLAAAGTCVTHCPCSNQLLASGFCPVCDMEQAGLRVGLGVDGSASNNGSNLISEVRTAFLLQRSRYGADRLSHNDAIRWATQGSAACLGRPELGRIVPGAVADLALFSLEDLRFSGAVDPVAAIVTCGTDRADHVMVNGRWVVENGTIPGLDIAASIRRHTDATKALHKV